jgi:Uma2 family endonuclease
MSSVIAKHKTADEYLAMERASATKHEFFDGYVVAMAGGSERHNVICGNVLAEVRGVAREKGCRVYPSDMRVGVLRKRGYYFYPDVSVVCGEPELEGNSKDILQNSVTVFEVQSPAAAAYDKSDKFKYYRRIASLKVFVLISQKEPYVEVHQRLDFNNWQTTFAEGIDQEVIIPVIDARIAMRDIYAFVEFEQSSDAPSGLDDESI